MANYSARFIKNFSTLAAPLRELTRMNVEWPWAERDQEAFLKIKNSLLDNATLAYYKVGAETEVIVDASPVGLGAMLTQKKRDGHRPVTYISRSLSPVEQRYSPTEREDWLFAGRASIYVCTWLEQGSRSWQITSL